MHPDPTSRYPSESWMSPAWRLAVDEGGALLARLLAYVGVLGLIVIGALQSFDGLADRVGPELVSQIGGLLPAPASVQPAKPPGSRSPGIPIAGAPGVFLRGSL
jgi:hypothetical protein